MSSGDTSNHDIRESRPRSSVKQLPALHAVHCAKAPQSFCKPSFSVPVVALLSLLRSCHLMLGTHYPTLLPSCIFLDFAWRGTALSALLEQGKSHDCPCFPFYFGHQEAHGQMCGPIKELLAQQFSLRVTCSLPLLTMLHIITVVFNFWLPDISAKCAYPVPTTQGKRQLVHVITILEKIRQFLSASL